MLCHSDMEAIIDIRPDSVVTMVVQAQTIEDFADERDSTEGEFVDSDTRYGWNPSTTLSGSTDQPDARQQVDYQGLTSRCWSHHTASSRRKQLGRRQEKGSITWLSWSLVWKSGVDSVGCV